MKERDEFDYREHLRRANEHLFYAMWGQGHTRIRWEPVPEPDIEPLTYEELITPADALLAHALGVRLD